MNQFSLPAAAEIRRFGLIDLVLIIAIAASAVAFIPVMHHNGPATVIVRCDDRVVARYPLDRSVAFRIRGIEGPLEIGIDRKGAAVIHATCRNQICVHTGHIRRSYQQIICAPNHVIVEILATHATDTPDAVVR